MENLLSQLSDAGIKTDGEQTPNITAKSSYRSNFGFYHIYSDGWELIFLKGVFKGHIRRLKGECPIEEKKLNELAQILSDSERCLRHPADVGLIHNGEHFIICRAEKQTQPFIARDCRDTRIPSPLTPVEASLGKHIGINDKHLFAKSPFASMFGETLSPFAYSLAESMPDIINPLFMGSTIKTYSPSIKPLFGRLYMNISNADVITSAFKVSPDFFYMNFLPSVYKNLKKPTSDVPNLSVLNLKDEEITSALDDIKSSAASLTREEMLSDSFFELTALCVMAWEMSYLTMWQAFTEILKLTGDAETAMKHAYKTRIGGLLTTDMLVMPFLDPAYEPVRLCPLRFEAIPAEELYKSLTPSRRLLTSKAKYIEKLTKMHTALDRMDDTFTAVSSLVMKIREILIDTAKGMIEKSIIKDESDIFYLEYKEIKNIVNDEFYGNIPFTLNFRKWQNHRQGALCLPPYLYEKDVENLSTITEKQMDTSMSANSIPCMSYFHKLMKTDNYICRNSFGIGDIKVIANYDAVIAESASIFSYVAQFCTIMEKPLYTGARFSRLLTEGRTIETAEDFIKI